MGNAQASNFAQSVANITNKVSQETKTDQTQTANISQTITNKNCNIKVGGNFTQEIDSSSYQKSKQQIVASQDSTLTNDISQQMQQEATSAVKGWGMGAADSSNAASTMTNVSNVISNNVSTSSTQTAEKYQKISCDNSTIVVGGDYTQLLTSKSSFLSEQVVNNKQIAKIANKVTQSITQKASATVSGGLGFLTVIILIIALLIYALKKPPKNQKTDNTGKNIIVTLTFLLITGLIIALTKTFNVFPWQQPGECNIGSLNHCTENGASCVDPKQPNSGSIQEIQENYKTISLSRTPEIFNIPIFNASLVDGIIKRCDMDRSLKLNSKSPKKENDTNLIGMYMSQFALNNKNQGDNKGYNLFTYQQIETDIVNNYSGKIILDPSGKNGGPFFIDIGRIPNFLSIPSIPNDDKKEYYLIRVPQSFKVNLKPMAASSQEFQSIKQTVCKPGMKLTDITQLGDDDEDKYQDFICNQPLAPAIARYESKGNPFTQSLKEFVCHKDGNNSTNASTKDLSGIYSIDAKNDFCTQKLKMDILDIKKLLKNTNSSPPSDPISDSRAYLNINDSKKTFDPKIYLANLDHQKLYKWVMCKDPKFNEDNYKPFFEVNDIKLLRSLYLRYALITSYKYKYNFQNYYMQFELTNGVQFSSFVNFGNSGGKENSSNNISDLINKDWFTNVKFVNVDKDKDKDQFIKQHPISADWIEIIKNKTKGNFTTQIVHYIPDNARKQTKSLKTNDWQSILGSWGNNSGTATGYWGYCKGQNIDFTKGFGSFGPRIIWGSHQVMSSPWTLVIFIVFIVILIIYLFINSSISKKNTASV